MFEIWSIFGGTEQLTSNEDGKKFEPIAKIL